MAAEGEGELVLTHHHPKPSTTAADYQNGGVDLRGRPEGAAGHREALPYEPTRRPARRCGRRCARSCARRCARSCARSCARRRGGFDEPADRGALQHDVGGHEVRIAAEQRAHQCAGQRVRRTGHYPERALRPAEVARVDLDDGGCGASLAQCPYPAWVQLDREHPRAGEEEVPGQRAGAGAKVDDQFAGPDGRVGDDACRPLVNERMPSPSATRRGSRTRPPGCRHKGRYGGGHGAPSP